MIVDSQEIFTEGRKTDLERKYQECVMRRFGT
jgi:hypothetical protein